MEREAKMEQIVSKSRFFEQRTSPRIICDYAAVIQGHDTRGKKFSERGRVMNLSSSGILLVTDFSLPENTEVLVKIALPTGSLEWGTSRLATIGNVVRNELQLDGRVGIGIKFLSYKFL